MDLRIIQIQEMVELPVHLIDRQFYTQTQLTEGIIIRMDLNQVSYQTRRLNTMNAFTAKFHHLGNPLHPPNYSTFDLTHQMFSTPQYITHPSFDSRLHPWISDTSFQYSCFDIKAQKVKDLMGSITHIQKQQTNPFDINLKITSIHQFTPFANFLSSKVSTDLTFMTTQNDSFLNQISLATKTSSLPEKQPAVEESSILQQSIFSDLDLLLQLQSLPDYTKCSLWEENADDQLQFESSLIYLQNSKVKVENVNSIQSHYFETEPVRISERQLIIHLILALQRIENKFFQLDYENMVWKIRPEINFWIPFYVTGSTSLYTNQILSLCNIRSKLDVVLQHIILRESKRQIYSKLLQVYSDSLRLFESILISHLQYPPTFLQFHISLQPIKRELTLLLTLLVKQQFINQPFCYFGRQYLYSETQVFKCLLDKLTEIDYCDQDEKYLVRSLGLSCFSTILYSLNVFLHSNREEWEKSNNQQFYFGLLFEQRKQDVDKIIQKLNQIHQDDQEMYNICKETLDIRITMDYSQLHLYQREWKGLFQEKTKQLGRIARRMERERRCKLEEVIQQKTREIQEMKRELSEKLAQSVRLKSESKEKQKMLIQVYKKEIQKKIEAKKLLKLIEIEEEKGYLLDDQLKERDILLTKKYELLGEHPEVIKMNIQKIEEEIHLDQSRRNIMIEVSSQPPSEPQIPPPATNPFAPISIPPSIPLPPSSKQKPNAYHKSQSYNQPSRLIKRPSVRSLPGSAEQNISVFPDDSERSQSEAEIADLVEVSALKGINMEVPLKISLDVCVYDVLKGQVQVLNFAYRTILYNKYRLQEIFSFLHKYILTANGEHATDLLSQSVDPHSFLNITHLKDYFFSENIKDEVSALEPIFYRSDTSPMFGTLNLIQPTSQRSLEVAIGLKFHKLPQILKPIFNYIQMTKYMEIFAFSLRIRHCVHLIQLEWKTLQTFQRLKQKIKQRVDTKLLKRLFDIRYKIQCFFNLFQNYFYLCVVQKEYKFFSEQILRNQEIENLPNIHNKFLEKIILRGFIQTHHELAGRFKKTFMLVKEFHNIVGLFCGDDIDTYAKPDIDERLRRMEREFVELYKILQNTIG